MHGTLPEDFADRIAQLMVDSIIMGFMRPRPIELFRKGHPIQAIDLDVVLLGSGGQRTVIDFAIPDLESFKQQASQGELSLNDQVYGLHWLDKTESIQVATDYFDL